MSVTDKNSSNNFFSEKRAFLSTESENNIELEKKIEIRERQNGKIREQRNYEKINQLLAFVILAIFDRKFLLEIE